MRARSDALHICLVRYTVGGEMKGEEGRGYEKRKNRKGRRGKGEESREKRRDSLNHRGSGCDNK